jgi:predicted TIM-barrel fold metal-dependent hydrolase
LLVQVIDLFGYERVLFASNFPVDRAMASTTLPALLKAQHALVEGLPEAQRRALFAENARKIYRLDQVS